jgi:hypothetical protein
MGADCNESGRNVSSQCDVPLEALGLAAERVRKARCAKTPVGTSSAQAAASAGAPGFQLHLVPIINFGFFEVAEVLQRH